MPIDLTAPGNWPCTSGGMYGSGQAAYGGPPEAIAASSSPSGRQHCVHLYNMPEPGAPLIPSSTRVDPGSGSGSSGSGSGSESGSSSRHLPPLTRTPGPLVRHCTCAYARRVGYSTYGVFWAGPAPLVVHLLFSYICRTCLSWFGLHTIRIRDLIYTYC